MKKLFIVNKLGAPSRRGEELAVTAILRLLAETRLSLQIVPLPSGTVEGGDVLFAGECALIGSSHRTTKEGIESVSAILEPLGIPVFSIPIICGLHLKSCCSLISNNVIVIADSDAGRQVRAEIEKNVLSSFHFDFLTVPDEVASNVLRIDSHVVIQDGFPESESILQAFADAHGLSVHKLNMSEFIKADGALTCCNVLFDL